LDNRLDAKEERAGSTLETGVRKAGHGKPREENMAAAGALSETPCHNNKGNSTPLSFTVLTI
jgi:hypothetical protein